MIPGVIIKKLNKLEDSRGWLTEVWREDESGYKPVMSYVSQTMPGVVRGPHEHKFQSDCFVFIGPGSFELYLWDRASATVPAGRQEASAGKQTGYMKIKAGEDNPTMVIVPPGVVHGYKCVSDTPGWCINLPNKLYKGKNKQEEIDEIRHEDDPESLYKIN